MTPGQKLRAGFANGGVVRAMAAHSPLSARLAEEAGFDAIWASGFELSALHGVPDASIVTMTQHLDTTRAMADACALPVIADIDTGFGNAINVIHAVKAYARAGAAAIVMEDKSFPKMTSLIAEGRQDLVRIAEFEGKIRAACDARPDGDLVVIARTEALIAGLGQEEALRRAAAYAEAGADLILVHSKAKTPDEIEAFCRAWTGPVPLVLVPTAYPEMSVERMRAIGNIAVVIYGNHAIRACVQAMRDTFAAIIRDGDTVAADRQIATVADVFALQGMDELKRQEAEYLR